MAATDITGMYLARCVAWEWHDAGTIDILDEQGDVVETLNGWQTLVFHHADANTTVGELIAIAKGRPPIDPSSSNPIEPTRTVMAALAALTDDLRAVELRADKSELDSKHNLPVSERHLLDDE